MTTKCKAFVLIGVLAAATFGAVPTVLAQTILVTEANPVSAAQGTLNLNVTISGKNFKAGAVVSFYKTGTTDTGGVIVHQTTYKRSAQLIATIDVPDTATPGSYDIVVRQGGSQEGTGPHLFRVDTKPIDACSLELPTTTSDGTSGSPGWRDASFGGGIVLGPKFMAVGAAAIQRLPGFEDKTVVVGSTRDTCAGGSSLWTIVRYRADGTLDSSFGDNGVATKTFDRGYGLLWSVAIDASGRIVVGGYRSLSSSANYGVVARYTANGQLDTTFAPDGLEPGIRSLSLQRYMTEARAIAIQPDGKIVIVGTDGGAMAIFRLTNTGAWDTGFNSGAVKPQLRGRYVDVGASGWAYAVALQGSGDQQRILVAGRRSVERAGNTADADGAVWRFTMGGLPDSSFGQSGVVTTGHAYAWDVFNALALDQWDRIVVTGSRNMGPDVSDPVSAVLARYEFNGGVDPEFNGGNPIVVYQEGWTDHSGNALAIDSAGRLLVGGSAVKHDAGGVSVDRGAALWRFTPNGERDTTFGSNGWIVDPLFVNTQSASWMGLALQADGKVVAAGTARWVAPYPVLIRYWQ